MPIRTDATEVEALLIGYAIASGQLTPFIATASLWVDNYLDGQTCVPADKLEPIERYIAAHLFALSQPAASGVSSISAVERADITTRYSTPSSNGQMRRTSFIESAAAFDPCGIVGEHWLGQFRARWRVGAGYDERHAGAGNA